MHNGVIRRRGLPLRYVALDLAPGRLRDFLRVVRESNVVGGNVTIPFKEEAAALADTRSDAVVLCGAANVLCVRRGRLHAENTDGPGFLDALAGAGWGKRFRRVVLLGAGGSARGIACALGRSGTRELVVLNRTRARARAIARVVEKGFPRMAVADRELGRAGMTEEFRGADLIVQCTSQGLHGEWANFPLEAVEKRTCFADIVYRSGGTLLVRELRKRGVPAIDGLPMLAHQAARSFALWTGCSVPAKEFLSLARRAAALRAPAP